MNPEEAEKRITVLSILDQVKFNHLYVEYQIAVKLIDDLTQAMKAIKNVNAENSELGIVQLSIKMIDYSERKKTAEEELKKMKEKREEKLKEQEVKEHENQKHEPQFLMTKDGLKSLNKNTNDITTAMSQMQVKELHDIENQMEETITNDIGMI